MNTFSLTHVGLSLFGLLAFCMPFAASAAQINITMTDSTFVPKVTTITVGDTVTWKNTSSAVHTVSPDLGTFSPRTLQPNESFSFTFTSPGTMNYHCDKHGAANGVGMAGSIVVNSPTVGATPPTTTGSSASTANTGNSSLAAQAQALLDKVQSLQSQLAGGVGATTGTGSSSGVCPNIGRVLKLDSTGDDVTRLQQFLARDPSVYPEGTVTGYYGGLTEKAVQRWQTKYNIVSSGSAATTGYGVVGPRTAAAIALLCSTGAAGGTAASTGVPAVGGYIQVSPISGNSPLRVNVVATLNTTNLCTGAIFTLTWGDNSTPIQIPVSANNCAQVAQTFQHVYTTGGTYVITLASGAHQVTAPVTVYQQFSGSIVPQVAPTQSPTQTPGSTLTTYNPPSLTPIFGGNPKSVQLSFEYPADRCNQYQLTWGDGSNSNPAGVACAQSTNLNTFSASHTYSANGSYTIILTRGAQMNPTGVTINN